MKYCNRYINGMRIVRIDYRYRILAKLSSSFYIFIYINMLLYIVTCVQIRNNLYEVKSNKIYKKYY